MENQLNNEYQKMTVFSRCKWFTDRDIESENDMNEYFKKAFIRSVVWNEETPLKASTVKDMTESFLRYINDSEKLKRENELLFNTLIK